MEMDQPLKGKPEKDVEKLGRCGGKTPRNASFRGCAGFRQN
jgi:hypothetical protein